MDIFPASRETPLHFIFPTTPWYAFNPTGTMKFFLKMNYATNWLRSEKYCKETIFVHLVLFGW